MAMIDTNVVVANRNNHTITKGACIMANIMKLSALMRCSGRCHSHPLPPSTLPPGWWSVECHIPASTYGKHDPAPPGY